MTCDLLKYYFIFFGIGVAMLGVLIFIWEWRRK